MQPRKGKSPFYIFTFRHTFDFLQTGTSTEYPHALRVLSIQRSGQKGRKALYNSGYYLQDFGTTGGLHLVQRFATVLADLPEMAGRKSRHLLELGAQVGRTRIVQLVGNLAERQLAVSQQLLHPFDFLCDEVLFDRRVFDLRNNELTAP